MPLIHASACASSSSSTRTRGAGPSPPARASRSATLAAYCTSAGSWTSGRQTSAKIRSAYQLTQRGSAARSQPAGGRSPSTSFGGGTHAQISSAIAASFTA